MVSVMYGARPELARQAPCVRDSLGYSQRLAAHYWITLMCSDVNHLHLPPYLLWDPPWYTLEGSHSQGCPLHLYHSCLEPLTHWAAPGVPAILLPPRILSCQQVEPYMMELLHDKLVLLILFLLGKLCHVLEIETVGTFGLVWLI